MKLFQFIFSIITIILTGLAVIKVFEVGQYTAIDYLILSNAAMFVTIIISALVKHQENGQDSQEKPGLSQ
jgi:hypothetical protein